MISFPRIDFSKKVQRRRERFAPKYIKTFDCKSYTESIDALWKGWTELYDLQRNSHPKYISSRFRKKPSSFTCSHSRLKQQKVALLLPHPSLRSVVSPCTPMWDEGAEAVSEGLVQHSAISTTSKSLHKNLTRKTDDKALLFPKNQTLHSCWFWVLLSNEQVFNICYNDNKKNSYIYIYLQNHNRSLCFFLVLHLNIWSMTSQIDVSLKNIVLFSILAFVSIITSNIKTPK